MNSLPVLGFEGRDDACTQDAKPLVVRWQDGRLVGGILAPLDPQWLKAYQQDLARMEELRAEPNVVLIEDWKSAQD